MYIELKPCPFCRGKIIKFTGTYRKTQMFVCNQCGADVCFYGAEYEPKASKAWNRRAETVKDQPSADVVEVRRGEWNKNGNGRDCQICGFKYYANGGFFNYCPNCGAKMDGKGGTDT